MDDRAEEGGNVLFFVHGYNSDLQAVADCTRWLQEELSAAGWNGNRGCVRLAQRLG